MRVLITTEQRFVACQGVLYVDAVADYGFWQRYLDAFEQVTIVARIREVADRPSGWLVATGEQVDYFSLPYYQGPAGFMRQAWHYWRAIRRVAAQSGAFILRVPAMSGTLMWIHLWALRKPFALEVVGDPHEALSPHVWRTWWIRPIRWLSTRLLQLQCRTATAGIAYVTQRTLQQRYMPSTKARSYGVPTGIKVYDIPDVRLDGIGLATAAERHELKNHRIVFVGSLAALYKGQEILLRAFAQCAQTGLDLELVMVGGGRHQAALEDLARELGISDRVRFAGQISDPQAVYGWLRWAQLFILPSYTEGLPRAMIEAMACGLPCIGTAVGGMPELLPPEDLVPPGDVKALADKICAILTDPARMARMSKRNLEAAQAYRAEVLRPQRLVFYQHVRSVTEDSRVVRP